MPRTKISEFSSTPANNTDIDSINIAEGCAPSGINDAIRELMAQLKDFQVGSAGDPVTVGGVLTVQAGAVGTPAITTAGDTNTGIFFPAADTIAFAEGGAEVARFDSGGNLGLGVTPSAWGGSYRALQFASGAIAGFSTTSLDIYGNAYDSGAGAWKYQNSSQGATRYASYNGQHQWFNAPSGTAGNAITFTQAMTLDASGNLGIGTTSPTSRLEVRYNSAAPISWGGTGSFNNNYGSLTWGTDLAIVQANAGYSLVFNTNGNNERARIDSSGKFLVGTTSGGSDKVRFGSAGATENQLGLISTDDASGNGFVQFRRSDVTSIGSISRVGTTNAVAYNTTSDYRLKTVVGAVTGQGARIDALKPIDYFWTEGGQQARGFLAHEFQEVYSNSVTGTKDAVDADGNPVYQSMQAATSEVIADLVAEIQSLRKRLADAGIA